MTTAYVDQYYFSVVAGAARTIKQHERVHLDEHWHAAWKSLQNKAQVYEKAGCMPCRQAECYAQQVIPALGEFWKAVAVYLSAEYDVADEANAQQRSRKAERFQKAEGILHAAQQVYQGQVKACDRIR